MTVHATKTERLAIRLTPDAKLRLRVAASAANQPLSSFVLESALDRATDVVMARTRFQLGVAEWAEFQSLLNREPRSNPLMMELLHRPEFFDRGATAGLDGSKG